MNSTKANGVAGHEATPHELYAEIERLRTQLADAQAEIERLTNTPGLSAGNVRLQVLNDRYRDALRLYAKPGVAWDGGVAAREALEVGK